MIIRDGRRPNGDVYRAGKRLWRASEDRLLRARYADTPTYRLAVDLRRPMSSVYQRARVLGLAKSAAYLATPLSGRTYPGSQRGLPTRFPKGHVPANKGTRRPGWAPGRMRETQFTKGIKPHTWVPVGTEVIGEDGYRKRKIADDRSRPSRFNWAFVHVLVWEAAHGPVPKGHAVAFKTRDKSDTRLENLELLTRRDLMLRNSVHNLPKELVSTIQLLGALNRQIRRRTRNAEQQDRRSA